MRPSWDEYFMLQAKLAACRSTCNSRPQGAVLVRDRRVIATGYNGALPGQEHCSDHHKELICPRCHGRSAQKRTSDIFYCNTCNNEGTILYCRRRATHTPDSRKDRACVSSHAEANAIAQAARLGIATDRAVLYCTTRPCIICTKLLIQAGIAKVFYELDYDSPEENWLDCLPMKQLAVGPVEAGLAIQMLHPNTSKRRLGKTE